MLIRVAEKNPPLSHSQLPELSVNPTHGNKRAVHQLGIQLLGISLGVTTMFVIALYERDLQRLMSP